MADEADVDTKKAAAVAGVAPRSGAEWRKDCLAAAGIFLFAFALYLLPAVRSRPLYETPELRIASVAREMVRSGDYIVPMHNGEPRLNKPPLPYWLTAICAKMLSGSKGLTQSVMTRATELPPAFFSALCLAIVVMYGAAVFSRAAGIISALALGFCMLVTRFAQLGYGDTILLCMTTGALCSTAWIVTSARPGLLSALSLGISLGLAILTKGHIPLLLVLAPVIAEVLIRHRFNGRKAGLFLLGLVLALGIAGSWFYLVLQKVPNGMNVMMSEAAEAYHPVGHHQSDRFVYYFYRLLGGVLPWTPTLLFGFLFYITRSRRAEKSDHSGPAILARENLRFFSLAFVLGFIGFYAAAKQQDYYLLPIMPAMMLALGCMLSHFKSPGGVQEERFAWTQIVFGIIAGIAVALFPLVAANGMGIKALGINFAQTAASAENWSWLAAPNGFAYSVPAGIVLILLHLYMGRQAVEGKPLFAAIALAIVAYCGLGANAFFWAGREKQNITLGDDAAKLKPRFDQLGADVRIYVPMIKSELALYYLDVPRVFSETDLAAEAAGKTNDEAPKRVFVARKSDFKQLQNEYNLSAPAEQVSEDALMMIELDRSKDWPVQAKSVLKAREEQRHKKAG